MTHGIFRRDELFEDRFSRTAAGLRLLVRMDIGSVKPEQAMLNLIVPTHSTITPALVAFHDGDESLVDSYADRPTIIVSVAVRLGINSERALDHYLELLSRFIEAVPRYEEMNTVLDEVQSWDRDFDPAYQLKR